MRNVNVTLHPSPRCSAETARSLAQQLAAAAAAGGLAVSAQGLTFQLTDFSLPLPVLGADGRPGGTPRWRHAPAKPTCAVAGGPRGDAGAPAVMR